MLFKWNLNDSPYGSFCFVETESIHHMFYECFHAKNLYFCISEWLSECGVEIPELLLNITVFGLTLPCNYSSICNLALLLYRYVLFNFKGKEINELFINWKRKMSGTEKIERLIAMKKNKINIHLTKWENWRIGSCLIKRNMITVFVFFVVFKM